MLSLEESIIGCILGTATGDALGLCCEGLSRRRQKRMYPNLDRPRFILGRSMISDDTEHTCMLAQALIVSSCKGVEHFERDFSMRLRYWLLGLPAGIGRATLRAIVRMWLGFSPGHSGVFASGNGPSMRSALLGVLFGDDPDLLRQWVRASTRLTHTDPKAEFGAFAVALAAHHSRKGCTSPSEFHVQLCQYLGADAYELTELVGKAVNSTAAGESTEVFADSLGLQEGVSGYTYHTVPVVMHAWFRKPRDFRAAVLDMVHCGGDADSTAAILGGIIGAGIGKAGVPPDWLDAICDWPRSIAWMERLGARLARVHSRGVAESALPLSLPGQLFRNLIFAILVLALGFRRLAPPY